MADQRVSELTAVTTPAGTDEFPVNQSGTSKRMTLAQIFTWAWTVALLQAENAAGPALANEAASSTNPTVIPNKADLDSGLGWISADLVALVAGAQAAVAAEDPADLAAGETSLWVYDADEGALMQATVGAEDSGGSGYRVLRIPNVSV